MRRDFNEHIDSYEDFVNDVALEMGEPGNTPLAEASLVAVLHVLRDSIGMEESIELISQLPFLVKAFYVDGWVPRKEWESGSSAQDFFVSVERKLLLSANSFKIKSSVEKIVEAVFRVVRKYAGGAEIRDIQTALPHQLSELFKIKK